MIKKILITGALATLVGTAHAGSMCVPKISSGQSYSYISSVQEDNNRGYFALGTSCVSGSTICKNTLVRGEAHCSAAPFMPADNWETNGRFCYCRFTQVRAPNGYLATRAGGWVFRNVHGSASDCASNCAANCAFHVRLWPTFRRALIASPAS